MTERETVRVEGAPKQPTFLSHAVCFGGLVFTSGAAPRVPETHAIPEGFEAQARQTFANLETVLRGCGSSLAMALKVTVYLAHIGDWAVMNAIYEEYIDQTAAPARTTIEVSAMNNGYLIEVEAIAARLSDA
jgi:2-iminobutanoate/2-iminopropanoate deaminase